MTEESSAFGGAREALVAASLDMELRLRRLVDSKGKVAEEIHEVRKLGKRLRGALMIARDAKPCIRWVAVIGRMLGGTRDAVVRADTWARLGFEEPEAGSIEAVIGALIEHQAKAAARKPPAEVVEWSLAALSQIRERLEDEKREELVARCEKGAEQMLRRLRKRLKKAAGEAEDEDFHEARKAVKAWLGGMQVLAPERQLPVEAALDKLADHLGEEHDLDVLGAWLTARGFTPATAPRVWKRLPKLQSRARRKSLAMIRREVLPALKAQVKSGA